MENRTVRGLTVFIVVSFAFSWAVALFVWRGGGLAGFGAWIQALLLLYMCGPAVGALVCAGLFERGRRLDALGLRQPRWREMPWAWLGIVMLCVGALAITLAVPGYGLGDPVAATVNALDQVEMSEAQKASTIEAMELWWMPWMLGLSSLVLGPLINTPLMLSEELGWRGYVWHVLERFGFWRASAATGLLWGVWHAPIVLMGYNYPTMPVVGAFLFTLFCILFSPIYSWLRVTTRSVWGPALAHGTTNALAGYMLMWQDPADMPFMGLLGVGGLIAMVIANILIWRRQKRRD